MTHHRDSDTCMRFTHTVVLANSNEGHFHVAHLSLSYLASHISHCILSAQKTDIQRSKQLRTKQCETRHVLTPATTIELSIIPSRFPVKGSSPEKKLPCVNCDLDLGNITVNNNCVKYYPDPTWQ